jgi:hypothetical protein
VRSGVTACFATVAWLTAIRASIARRSCGRTPQRFGFVHLTDQIANFVIYMTAVQTLSANRAGSLGGATGPRWPASPTTRSSGTVARFGRARSRVLDRAWEDLCSVIRLTIATAQACLMHRCKALNFCRKPSIGGPPFWQNFWQSTGAGVWRRVFLTPSLDNQTSGFNVRDEYHLSISSTLKRQHLPILNAGISLPLSSLWIVERPTRR